MTATAAAPAVDPNIFVLRFGDGSSTTVYPTEDGMWRASYRSHDGVDVSRDPGIFRPDLILSIVPLEQMAAFKLFASDQQNKAFVRLCALVSDLKKTDTASKYAAAMVSIGNVAKLVNAAASTVVAIEGQS